MWAGVSPRPPAVSEEKPQPPSPLFSQTSSSLRRGRIFMCVCGGPCVRCVKKPPAPPYHEPSPNHNKPETNSKRGCNTLHVWISLLLKIFSFFLFFFLPGVKLSYTDHVLPCKLDNIPSKSEPLAILKSARR